MHSKRLRILHSGASTSAISRDTTSHVLYVVHIQDGHPSDRLVRYVLFLKNCGSVGGEHSELDTRVESSLTCGAIPLKITYDLPTEFIAINGQEFPLSEGNVLCFAHEAGVLKMVYRTRRVFKPLSFMDPAGDLQAIVHESVQDDPFIRKFCGFPESGAIEDHAKFLPEPLPSVPSGRAKSN